MKKSAHPFLLGTVAAALLALAAPITTNAQTAWAIDKAAAPYKGTKIKVMFLDRPGYRAIIKLLPEFDALFCGYEPKGRARVVTAEHHREGPGGGHRRHRGLEVAQSDLDVPGRHLDVATVVDAEVAQAVAPQRQRGPAAVVS